MAILVVVCGKRGFGGKMLSSCIFDVVKLKNCQIGTKIHVVLHILSEKSKYSVQGVGRAVAGGGRV